MTSDTHDLISSERTTEEKIASSASHRHRSGHRNRDRVLPTRQECYLADEQPAVSEVELAPEDLSRSGPQREGDGSGRGVLQIFQGHIQSERRRPRLQDPRFKLTFHLVEDSHTLCVTVVAVHLETAGRTAKVEGNR